MATATVVGVIGATGNTGRTVVNGLLASQTNFIVISLTRASSVDSVVNQEFRNKGVRVVPYDLSRPRVVLVQQLQEIDVLISCIAWEHLEHQLPWIEAAKLAGVKRFVPSEWVGPAPKGVIDIKDRKLEILAEIQRVRLGYTIIDVGCWFQVFVPKVPSGRSDHRNSKYIDHRIVGDGHQKFALTDMADIGTYVAQIVSDPRTLNRHVFAYTEVLSMKEIWEMMALASGEKPLEEFVTEIEIREIIRTCRNKLRQSSQSAHHPSNIMDTANFNMGQYRISWCLRGDNTPEYADYLGYLDFWKLYPEFPRGRDLKTYFQSIMNESHAD